MAKKKSPQDLVSEEFPLKRELIVVAKSEVELRAKKAGLESAAKADISPLTQLLNSENISLQPIFGRSEEKIKNQAAALATETGVELPDLSVFYQVEAEDDRLDELAKQLNEQDAIETAYVKPPAEPARLKLNENILPQEAEPPVVTPNYTSRQDYLKPAPVGIDVPYAWTHPGGRGAGIDIIDIEWGWRFTHEDLKVNQGGVLSGTNSSSDNHGTAVLGEFSGDNNTIGITGISPDAKASAVSLVTHGTAQAIRIAADKLNPGDIILLEVHRAGPNSGQGSGQYGYIAIEWWPDDFAAIRYAVAKGIIVVEAAGNGGQNLDDPIYNTPGSGFPASWKNPFNTANPSSYAVLVGAGLPPKGTHSRNEEPGWGDVYADRGRCFFSNYGSRVDAQGWGWEVTTTGYGDLQGGTDKDQWYTDQFSGTSSASPIVVGALACVQGILKSQGRPLMTSAKAAACLRATGSPQQDAPGFAFHPNMSGSGYPQNHPARPKTQRIGNRPNLRQLIPHIIPSRKWYGYENLGGFCTDGVGVSSWAANRLDCFVVGNNRGLYHKWYNGSQWLGWEYLGGHLYSAPAAVSWGSNRIDVFGLGGNRAMYHKWYNGSQWSGWENLGGFCTDGVGVCSWAANRLDCFVVGNSRNLYHKWYNGSQWSGWENLGGQLYSAPTAVSWGPNRIDVFGLGGNRAMYHKWYNGSQWSGWENLGGFCTDGVGVCSWAANRLDCFVVGNNRNLYHKWYNGSQWLGWENLGGHLYSAPEAVSWGPNRIDVFGLGGNRAMYHKWYT
jgi:hypothetical protein